MYIKKFEEKIPGKVGECIYDSKKCKSFQGPPILAHFAHLALFHYICKNVRKLFWDPLDQIQDPLLDPW